MISIRTIVVSLLSLAFATFALPTMAASGDNKIYTLDLPKSLTGGASGVAVTADFGNVSPAGNSTYKSLKLFAPPGITITGVAVPAGYTATATIKDNGKSVWVDVINLPVKPFGPKFPLGLTVDTSCSGGGTWSTKDPNDRSNTEQVWTGTGYTGQNFSYASGNRDTSITTGCNGITYNGNQAGGNGTLSGNPPTDSAQYGVGAPVTVLGNTGSPALSMIGNTFTGWTFTSGGTGTVYNAGQKFPMPSTPPTLYAKWAPNTYTLTYKAGTGGSIVGNASQSVLYRASGTEVEAKPNDNYRFVSWNDGGTSPKRTDTAGASNVTYTASFAPNRLTISAPKGPSAGTSFPVTISGDGPSVLSVSVSGTNCVLSEPLNGAANVVNGQISVTIAQVNPPADQKNCILNVSAENYQTAEWSFTNVFVASFGSCTAFVTSKGEPVSTLDPDQDIAYGEAGQWGLRRGVNADGTCPPLSYTFTLKDNVASLIYDKSGGQMASFKYVIVWNPVAVDGPNAATAGWSQTRPRFSWGIPDPDPTACTNPADCDFVPALYCVLDDSLSQYGGPNEPPLDSLLPTVPSVAPFTGFNDNNRPQYKPGQKAQMCIAQQGATAFGKDVNGVIQILYWHKVIDQADGFTIRD